MSNETKTPNKDNNHNITSSTVHSTRSDNFVASCNMNSGGYVNFLKGKYYYSDAKYNNSLFMSDSDGKNAVCVDSCSDSITSCITVDETAVYYLKISELDIPLEIGDYSILHKKQIRRFCDGKIDILTEDNVLSYALSKDYIFYSSADLKVYRMKHDGTEKTAILELSYPMSISVSEDKLFVHMGEAVISTDFDGKNSLISNIYHYTLAVDESTVYFINADDFSLNKTDLSGQDVYSVIQEPILSFNVYNGRLVYEKMDTGEIVIADMNGANPEIVCTGTSPVVLNGHLFFLNEGVICIVDI